MWTFDSFNTKRHNLSTKCEIKGPFCKFFLRTCDFVRFSRNICFYENFCENICFPENFRDMSICSMQLQKISCFCKNMNHFREIFAKTERELVTFEWKWKCFSRKRIFTKIGKAFLFQLYGLFLDRQHSNWLPPLFMNIMSTHWEAWERPPDLTTAY